MICDTIQVPKNIKIVGEAWSQIAAYGVAFGDIKNPKPLFRAGKTGEIGNVERQDLLGNGIPSKQRVNTGYSMLQPDLNVRRTWMTEKTLLAL